MLTEGVMTRRWNIEHSLYALAFLLAVGVRLVQLGATPLTDHEASWALQALSIARGEPVSLGPQPLYPLLTGSLFFLFGSTNFLARILPALAGSALVLLPVVYRRQLGQHAGIILAFALALDPGLLAISRSAGSPIPALAFSLAALTALYTGRWLAAGVLGGLALLSGPGIIYGGLALALTWGAGYFLQKEERMILVAGDEKPAWRTLLYGLVATLILAGTLLLRVPQGLGALGATIPSYFEGWAVSSGVPALRLPTVLLVYQPLAILFGLLGILRAWRDQGEKSGFIKLLGIWAGIALLLAMVYPSRQTGDLVWVIVPLWAIAAYGLAGQFTISVERPLKLVSTAQAILIVLLLAFAWLMLASLGHARAVVTPEIQRNVLVLIVGASLMAGLTSTLVALGWSGEVSRQGMLWGITISLLIWMVPAVVSSTGLRAGTEHELWKQPPHTSQTDLMLSTLGDLSAWQTGHRQTIDIAVIVEAPSLQWALRDYPNARFRSHLAGGEMPTAIISYLGQETPALTASYRGQDFSWQVYPAWQGVLPPNLPQWLAFRKTPVQPSMIILWARVDIFPDDSQGTQGLEIPMEEFPSPGDE